MSVGRERTVPDARQSAHSPQGSEGRFAWRIERAFGEGVGRWRELASVEVDGRAVTYGELERRTDRLAARLAQRGVGCGDVVGLACEDVVQFAVGALGILKVGAAYLSLD